MPAWVLLWSVVVAALRSAVAQAGSSACFVWDVVLEVGLGGGPSADRPGAGGVPDLGQVPQLDPGIVAPGLETMVAGISGDRVEGDDQVWLSAGPGAQLPGPVSAGRLVLAGGREGESRSVPVPGRAWRPRSFPFPEESRRPRPGSRRGKPITEKTRPQASGRLGRTHPGRLQRQQRHVQRCP